MNYSDSAQLATLMTSPVLVIVFAFIIFCILITIGLCARSSRRKLYGTRYWLDEEKAERRHSKEDKKRKADGVSYERCKELIAQYDRLHDPVIQPTYTQLRSSPRRSPQRTKATPLPALVSSAEKEIYNAGEQSEKCPIQQPDTPTPLSRTNTQREQLCASVSLAHRTSDDAPVYRRVTA